MKRRDRSAFGAILYFGAMVFPLALPPFATWQECRRRAYTPIRFCRDAAVSTVVLTSLRERLTRSSACQLATGEDAANPPRSETGTKSRDNARAYEATYRQAEKVSELIPYMLQSFLDSDRNFTKVLRESELKTEPAEPAAGARHRQRSHARNGAPPSNPDGES